MLTNLYSILEKRPCKTSGGFSIPYTAILENGVVCDGYRVVTEGKGSGNSAPAGGNNTTTANSAAGATSMGDQSIGGGGADGSPRSTRGGATPSRQQLQQQGKGTTPHLSKKEERSINALVGCLKKEYDLSPATVRQNLGLEEESITFNAKRRIAKGQKHLPVKAMFVRRLQREEYAFESGGEGGSNLLSVEYLTTPQTHNLLTRGDPSTDPVNKDSLVALAEIEREQLEKRSHGRKLLGVTAVSGGGGSRSGSKHHHDNNRNNNNGGATPSSSSDRTLLVTKGRTGLMQAVVTPNGDHQEIIRVVFESSSAKGGSFPDHATCTISMKRNVYPHNSPNHMGYERLATFDGPKLLTEDTTATLTEEVKERVLHATKFILASIADAVKRYAARAVFFFKISADGQLYFTFTPYIGLFNPGDNSTNRIEPLPRFKVPLQYESVLRRPKPSTACTFDEDLLAEPRLPKFGPIDGQVAKRHGGRRKSPRDEESWLLSELKNNGGGHHHHANSDDSDGSDDSPGGQSPGGSRKKRGDSRGPVIDYSKIMAAIEHQFPAPLPVYALEHLKTQRRSGSGLGMGHLSGGLGISGELDKQKRSPCAHHPRENPQASQDALARRQQCTAVNNVRTLLQGLEGKHRISSTLADTFCLTKAERKFLNSSATAAEELAGGKGSLAKKKGASSRGGAQTPNGIRTASRSGGSMNSTMQRSSSSLGGTALNNSSSTRAATGGGRLNGGEDRPSFHVAVGPESGYFNKSDMRSGPVTRVVKPLMKTKLRPNWDTVSGKKPVFAPKVDSRKKLREERLQREREYELYGPAGGSRGVHEEEVSSDLEEGHNSHLPLSNNQLHLLATPTSTPIQGARGMDLQYPELADFSLGHVTSVGGHKDLDILAGSGVPEETASASGAASGGALEDSALDHLDMSGRGLFIETLAHLDDELVELRRSGSVAATLLPEAGSLESGQNNFSSDSHDEKGGHRQETIDVAVVDPNAGEGGGSTGLPGAAGIGAGGRKPITATQVTVEDKIQYLMNHPQLGGRALVEAYRLRGRGGTTKAPPSAEAIDLLKARIEVLKSNTVNTMEYLYGLCYLLKSVSLAVREDEKKNRLAVTGGGSGQSGGNRSGGNNTAGTGAGDGAASGGRGGNTETAAAADADSSRLLFSVPPRELGHLEKKTVHLLCGLPYFEQMNNEENIQELQMLLVGARQKHHHAGGGIPTVGSLMDGLYCAHLDASANIVHCPTYNIRYKPPKFELQSVVTHFILNTVRTSFLEKMEELGEEYNVTTISPPPGATAVGTRSPSK